MEYAKNQVKLAWPLPILLVVDICGNMDLDLNSARTQIIMSDKWVEFEEKLALAVCSKIAGSVTLEYWNQLKVVLMENTKNEIFLRSLDNVEWNNNQGVSQ